MLRRLHACSFRELWSIFNCITRFFVSWVQGTPFQGSCISGLFFSRCIPCTIVFRGILLGVSKGQKCRDASMRSSDLLTLEGGESFETGRLIVMRMSPHDFPRFGQKVKHRSELMIRSKRPEWRERKKGLWDGGKHSTIRIMGRHARREMNPLGTATLRPTRANRSRTFRRAISHARTLAGVIRHPHPPAQTTPALHSAASTAPSK